VPTEDHEVVSVQTLATNRADQPFAIRIRLRGRTGVLRIVTVESNRRRFSVP